jgi:hypothetical protein
MAVMAVAPEMIRKRSRMDAITPLAAPECGQCGIAAR